MRCSRFFCGHLLPNCPVLWTPRLYCLSTKVDTSHTRQRKIPVYLNFATQPNAFTLIEKAAASTKVDST